MLRKGRESVMVDRRSGLFGWLRTRRARAGSVGPLIHTGEPFDATVDYKQLRDHALFAQPPVAPESVGLSPATATAPASQWEVFTDVSVFQRVYDSSYPERIMSFRVDSGYSTDHHAAANLTVARSRVARGTTRVVICYVVHIPGNNQAVFDRVKALIGQPFPRLVLMIDEESGRGFAGPGDHSGSFNQLAGMFAGWLGEHGWARTWAYANGFDRAQNLPHMDPRVVHEVRASWGPRDPGTYAQQYRGGTATTVPAGMPTSVAPFGSNVDLNLIRRSIGQIEADLGISVPRPAPKPPAPVAVKPVVVAPEPTPKPVPAPKPVPPTDWLAMATEAQVEALLKKAIADACAPKGAIFNVIEARVRSAFKDSNGNVVGVWTLVRRGVQQYSK